ncbi:MAG: AraC family transcriptional regulator ligand-binding domain-containing protein [Planctomycetota bacterium]
MTAYALGRGLEMDEITRRTNIKRSHLIHPTDRISDDAPFLLGQLISESAKGESATLHMARNVDLSAFGLWAQLGQSSADLDEAISAWVRFAPVLADRLVMRRYDEGDLVVMECEHPHDAGDHGFLPEVGTAVTYRVLKESIDAEITDCVAAVEFRHGALALEEEYRAYFGVPVRHDMTRNAVLFRADTLSTKSRFGDAVVNGYVQAELEFLEDQHVIPGDRHRISTVLDAILKNAEEFEFSAGAVARRMNLSLRALQRSLNEHDLSLRGLIQETREKRARELLAETDHSVERISRMLGYSDAPAFGRAFKRWTGLSPTAFRGTMQ